MAANSPAATAKPSERPAAPGPAANAKPPAAPPAPRLRVTLRSVPAGAEVFQGRDRVGETPVEVELDPGAEAEYRFARSGYRSLERLVHAWDGEVEVRLARAQAAERPARARGRPPVELDPYGKVDDLKPDPFR